MDGTIDGDPVYFSPGGALWSASTGTWRIDTEGAERVRITYRIYANSISDRTRHVDATHAFLSGSSVFLFTERLRRAPVRVDLQMPEDWGVATGLEPVQWIRYERAYYGAPGHSIRVTLDWALMCFDQRERRILGADRPTPRG